MLNEPALSYDDRPIQRPSPLGENSLRDPLTDLRPIIDTVFTIEREFAGDDPNLPSLREDMLLLAESIPTAVFEGKLKQPSEEAYSRLDTLLTPLNMLPMLRHRDGKDVIIVVKGRPASQPRPTWPNWILFAATVFSLLLVGTSIAAGEVGEVNQALSNEISANPLIHLWRGLPYAISLLLILGAHELGHYFVARRHKLSVTLPYFIPLPPPFSIFGTMGAFIQLREPMRNRKSLLDVGAAGPLMGLIFAIPILLIGLATSPVGPVEPGYQLLEGNSLLYALSKTLVFGQFLPAGNIDVSINQLAQAGWVGLLVTAINLIPLGQLDGGHILYSLVGDKARWLYIPVLVATVALTLFVSESWLIWLALLFIFGRSYAVPLDAVTPLNTRRRFIALLSLGVFIITFVPVPFTLRYVEEAAPAARDSVSALLPFALVFITLWLRGRGA